MTEGKQNKNKKLPKIRRTGRIFGLKTLKRPTREDKLPKNSILFQCHLLKTVILQDKNAAMFRLGHLGYKTPNEFEKNSNLVRAA